jgi:hypothetical protein
MAIDPEAEFKQELEVFSNEVEEAIQSFYAEQTIYNVAREDQNVHRALNRNAAFWNLTSRALQANAIIVLGRIFDSDPRAHTINRVLQLAAQNPAIFSKTALEKRKLPHAGKHTAEFMRTAYIPKKGDFQRLQKYADKAALERMIEKAESVDVTASAIVAAVQALAKINANGEWVDRVEHVDLRAVLRRA